MNHFISDIVLAASITAFAAHHQIAGAQLVVPEMECKLHQGFNLDAVDAKLSITKEGKLRRVKLATEGANYGWSFFYFINSYSADQSNSEVIRYIESSPAKGTFHYFELLSHGSFRLTAVEENGSVHQNVRGTCVNRHKLF